MLRPAITCPATTTAAAAASLMQRERTAALLVHRRDGLAVVSEHDLSARVLAVGRSPETPLAEVATVGAPEMTSDRTAMDALFSLMESGERYVRVVDAKRRLLGVVSDVDLVGSTWRSPLQLRALIESAPDVAGVATAGRGLGTAVADAVDGGSDPIDVARMVTLVIDAMTRRLLELAIARFGEPPVPWAWLALGSAARREQAVVTDQDHALAFDLADGALGEIDRYFHDVAAEVTSGLDAAGIPRCRADVVAENRSLRRPLEHWSTAFHGWLVDAGATAGRQASVMFDHRRAAGPLETERVLEPILASAELRRPFLRGLARQALRARPRGIRGRGGSRGLDVKGEGLTPIVNLARSYAIEAGVTAPGTLDRLAGAAERGRITEARRSDLSDAFRALWRLRFEHHARRVDGGMPVDDRIDPAAVGSLARAQLAEALRIVRDAQRSLRRDHGLRFVRSGAIVP
jgi:CBS domain-containing protein